MTSFEDKISLMIPAYLRGELSESERQEIENLAAKNPEIAADIEFQKNLKSAIAVDAEAYEPGDLGWARLSKAMEESGEIEDEISTKPKFWRYTAAILAVAAIGQAGVLGSMTFTKDQGVKYVTASDVTSETHMVTLGFNPEISVHQFTKNLQMVDGTITAGPSALGLYQVEFKSESACISAVETLQIQSNIVDTVSSCE